MYDTQDHIDKLVAYLTKFDNGEAEMHYQSSKPHSDASLNRKIEEIDNVKLELQRIADLITKKKFIYTPKRAS